MSWGDTLGSGKLLKNKKKKKKKKKKMMMMMMVKIRARSTDNRS